MNKILIIIVAVLTIFGNISFAQDKNLNADVNLNRYITLTVKSGKEIKLDFKSNEENTPVRVESGKNIKDMKADDTWLLWKNDYKSMETGFYFTSDGTSMTIYGDIIGFSCSSNRENITEIDVSKNDILEELKCTDNHLTSLDLSKNTKLYSLACYNNKLTSINVKECSKLYFLGCANNELTSLDISNNTNLSGLNCSNNRLSKLDLSKNSKIEQIKCNNNKLASILISKEAKITDLLCDSNKLETLDISSFSDIERFSCSHNKLTSIYVSNNTKLNYISCFGNPLKTKAINALFCSLPDRNSDKPGKCFLLNSEKDKNHRATKSTNTEIARMKNWNILFWYDGQVVNKKKPESDINGNGNYKCK